MTVHAPELQSIRIERHLDHSVPKVWRALTEGDLLAQWLLPGDFRAEIGHRFTLHAPATPDWNGELVGEVLDVQPPDRLVYRLHAQGAAPDGVTTTVTWTLRPSGDGTMLSLEQTGFRPQDAQNFHGASAMWPRFLARLAATLAADHPG